ncbi:hypothetical protein LZ518_11710 [Sphingomonas sp. RB56-2]|uniref:Uncharacterized protein n=1 Tax=Sphingomonas brevis TaxID=2908206 RepID=A0ABT0SBR5_9SPHN|nr:hypothetical protein [Sphingomonas brevis]MCL6741793.1 hypothetical protein [Sphingomonas brevis]
MDNYLFEADHMDEFSGETPLGMYETGAFEEFSGDQYEPFADESGAMFFENEDQFSLEGNGFDQYSFEEEGDQFSLGGLWRGIKKVATTVAPLAKKFAPQIGAVIGGALGGPAGAALGGKLGTLARTLEGEEESDSEEELNAPASVPAIDESLSESMADSATRLTAPLAQSMGSAITVTLASRAPLPVKAVVPILARAGGDVARQLAASSDPRARVLLRTIPTIQKRTLATLAAKARRGRPITPQTAVRVMRTQANRVLGNSQNLGRALANNARKRGQINRAAVARAERFM